MSRCGFPAVTPFSLPRSFLKIPVSFCWLLALAPGAAVQAGVQREEAVLIFESRKVVVAVPPGFTAKTNRDEAGLVQVHLAADKQQATLDLIFVPDPEGEALRSRGRKEKMVELFNSYVESSVEKAMRFEELEPRRGAGTYCVFTDASLVGKTELPPNEFRHLTVGIKAWSGVMTIVRLFSQETNSAEHQALLKVLRESVEERPVPLR
jgi:hypothetical protein